MTVHGQPDCPRGARYILKDYVNVSELITFMQFAVTKACLIGKIVVLQTSTICSSGNIQQRTVSSETNRHW